LREENAKLKRLVADLSLDRHVLQEIVRKKAVALAHLKHRLRLATLRYRGRRDLQVALRMRLRELAASRIRFGYRRLTVMLRREGWRVNAKRIYRLYSEDGPAARTKVRKKIARRMGVPLVKAPRPNKKWSMHFVAARLLDGPWFRVLAVVDQFTRE
jgi:putative transposase